MSHIDFDAINSAALTQYPSLLESWIPSGRVEGGEYSACNPTRSDKRPGSFKVNVQSGVWSDFATDDGGSDPVSLYAYLNGVGMGEAAKRLSEELRIDTGQRGRRTASPKKKQEEWRVVIPVPDNAPSPDFTHYQLGQPVTHWAYRDGAGRLLGHVCRFDRPTKEGQRKPDKEFLPHTFRQNQAGRREWRWKSWDSPRPLYGLDRLASMPDAKVLLVEGEKAADAAHGLAGDRLVCATWPGGSKAVSKADFSPLKGRRVCFWPDADKPGFHAAIALAGIAASVGFELTAIVVPDESWKEGTDIADFPDWTKQDLFREIDNRRVDSPAFQRIAKGRYGITLAQAEVQGQEKFPTPVYLDDVALPKLTANMIPGPLARICQDVAEALQVPLELALTAALAAVATAMQGKARVQVKPGWSEPLNLFQCCALPPGQRKSGVVEIFKRPLVQWEKERKTEMADTVKKAKSEKATLEQAINAMRRRIGSAKTAEDRRVVLDEVRQLESELPEIPVVPRLLADDVTPEAMAEIMEPLGGRVAIIEAEGGILDTLAGRYSKGVANLDLVLKAWGQEAVHVDRRGRDPIVLESPTLTLALCPQPSVISVLGENSVMRGRGLVGRMLFWLPKSLLGSRGQTRAVSQAIEGNYNRLILNLLALPARIGDDGQDTHHLIHLSPEALDVLEDFAVAVEKELGPGGEFADMTDWAGKLPGQAVRLAGLFHCSYCERPWDLKIEKDVMLAATNLASILVEHAKAALDLMGVDPRTECAKKIWAWLEREGVERFTGRDALEKVKGTFPTMKEINPGLDVLEEYGLIIKLPKEHKSQPYVVNPKARRD